jgi:Tol biopolymer transport system component
VPVFRALVAALALAAAIAAPSGSAQRVAGKQFLSFVRGPSIFVTSNSGVATRVLRGKASGNERDSNDIWYSEPAWSKDGLLAVTRGGYPTGSHWYADVAVVRKGKKWLWFEGTSAVSGAPAWAPDGRRIVFVGYGWSDGGGLYIQKLSAREAFELTSQHDDVDDTPTWSPDGSTIAFARTLNGKTRIYLVRPNGTGLRRLTTAEGWSPSWSPDGKRLAFDNGKRLGIVDADGRHLRYLPGPNGLRVNPAWSPDGKTIAFVRYRSAQSDTGDIWLVAPSGKEMRIFVTNASQPAWTTG